MKREKSNNKRKIEKETRKEKKIKEKKFPVKNSHG